MGKPAETRGPDEPNSEGVYERVLDRTPSEAGSVHGRNGCWGMDMTVETSADDDSDRRWLTYAELAAARGIDRQSARRLASRLKWRRQKDNQGIVRVYVPATKTDPQRGKADTSAHTSAAASADISRVIRVLEAAVASLREQSERDRGRADQAETRAIEADRRAAQAEAELGRLREAERARRARGVVTRLRAALRRE